jgi:phage terminase large subunit-like protein
LYVIADVSLRGSPAEWAKVALAAYTTHHADRIVGEVNNGGDLVEANLRATVASLGLNPSMLPYRSVRASRGKAVRAEPTAAMYEQGKVHHIGAFTELEDQMCGWVPGTGQKSPDRMDALVWAITDLVVSPRDQAVLIAQSQSNVISPY